MDAREEGLGSDREDRESGERQHREREEVERLVGRGSLRLEGWSWGERGSIRPDIYTVYDQDTAHEREVGTRATGPARTGSREQKSSETPNPEGGFAEIPTRGSRNGFQ